MTGLFMLPFANRETTAMSLLCACNGCFTVTAWYTMTKKKKLLPIALLWCGAVLLSIFFVRKIVFLTYSYTCCDCGYVENWVETQSERDEIKRALH